MTRILVVDDREENLFYLDALLAGHGHEVTLAHHGAEALTLARRSPPELVVSDLLMPVMDGYTLLRQWKVDQRLRTIPFIVYTATYTEPADEQLAYDLGADAFLLKPAEPEAFLEHIRHVLAGNLTAAARRDEPTEDETDLLKTYSATLIRKLEEKSRQLEEANRELAEDIARREQVEARLTELADDQRRATEALTRALNAEQLANEELRRVTHLRSSFLTAVSHEVRTPLTVVLGLAESLERHDDALGSEQRIDLTRRLQVNARRLGTLLDDLLDLDELADGQLLLDRRPCELRELVVAAATAAVRPDRQLTIELPTLDLDVDRARLSRVVMSLVTNASVHTPDGSPIEITATGDATTVTLRVVDHGPGIAPAERERIFEPFEQGSSVPRHRPGTGIGLSLARDFVRLHDGRLWAEETPGGGATFVVELPRTASPA